MRLLQINVSANSGSTGRIAEGIGIAAQKAGFSSWIAYGRHANNSSSNLIKIGSNLDHYEHAFETRLLDNHGLASKKATFSFLKEIDKIKPDVIHLHNIHGYFINFRILFSYLKKKDIPIVWTLHDCWPFTGHCAHFSFCKCNRWIKGCHDCPQKEIYPRSLLIDQSQVNYRIKKIFFNNISKLTIISVSRWLDNLVSLSFLNRHDHLFIYNGVDTDLFSPHSNTNAIRTKHNIQKDETMLLGVANVWNKRKGLYDFIELSKLLSPQEKIVLLGLTRKQINILPQNVIGLERTESTEQLAEYYSAADIVLNLSQEESFGLTTIEGFSCGTPGIGYNCTATPELFTPDTGYIVSPADFSRLLECIRTIKKNGKLFYSNACRKHVLDHFRAEDHFQDYINLYNNILSK